ncbi:MAG: Bax inhibitor-1/YccA family protein [Brevundimonas sp.]|uniref:Bax inhibitor-1/YccA family protein n=1 Tax=Brevundimonas sp. TaxID=1871086 RepID=UPI0027259A5F|nr:Bax inhibitor-1/YccA family protein [Brevundimonas sp.]MDO9588094.1 Bax inhibitor-1/YccA family protein [Brevundimonas sp.]
MSDFRNGYSIPATTDMSADAGLRSFMLGVYNKVALGLLVSAALAWVTGSYEPVRDLLFSTAVFPDGVTRLTGMTMLGMVVAFSPLVLLLGSNFVMKNPTAGGASALYWLIVALIGASMGTIVLVYTGASVIQTFLITSAAFGALSLFGYTTKKDMTGIGSFLIMGVIGLIIAMVVNIFLQNHMMQLIISAVGVLIFAGLTAYDTQRLKMTYYALGGNQTAMSVATSYGALSLYISFINMFQFLLMLFGGRR